MHIALQVTAAGGHQQTYHRHAVDTSVVQSGSVNGHTLLPHTSWIAGAASRRGSLRTSACNASCNSDMLGRRQRRHNFSDNWLSTFLLSTCRKYTDVLLWPQALQYSRAPRACCATKCCCSDSETDLRQLDEKHAATHEFWDQLQLLDEPAAVLLLLLKDARGCCVPAV
jgi:hypothetical protein